jgi:signal transduction histidine kinase
MRGATSSLRSRLLIRTAVALLLIFTGAAMYVLMRASLLSEFDAGLATEAHTLASLTEQDGHNVKVESDGDQVPEFSRADRPDYFQVRGSDGNTIARSPSLHDRELDRVTATEGGVTFHVTRLPSGRPGRIAAIQFKPRFDEEAKNGDKAAANEVVTLLVARDTTELERTLARLGWCLVGVSAIAVVASAAIMSAVIGRGLRPLNTLAVSIEKVGDGDLSERIELAGIPTEMVPVVQRLNELLARLDAVLAREKAFTADVAHELRTPLAGLETTLEVCATRCREPDAYHAVVTKCLRLTQNMHAMIDNLLMLARADARQLKVEVESVELAVFVRECWSSFEGRAAVRHLNVEWAADVPESVSIDRDKLRIVLNNLFDNAVTYAATGGNVRIAAAARAGAVEVTVANNGSQLVLADVQRVFDRFWRGDGARRAGSAHCGLGLPLCRKIVELLGGTIRAEARGDIFRIRVILPCTVEDPVLL